MFHALNVIKAQTCKAGNGADSHFFPEQQSSGAWLLKGLQVRLIIFAENFRQLSTRVVSSQANKGRCIEASETDDVYSRKCNGVGKQEWVLTQYNATGPGISSLRQSKQLTSKRMNSSYCLGFHHDHPLGVRHRHGQDVAVLL